MKKRRPAFGYLFEIVLFAMLGSMMFALQLVMEALPNIHLTAMFVITFTVVFRWRALFPIYVYIVLIGVRWGFGLSWIPYLYVWTLLWGAAMLLPKNMSEKNAKIVYPATGFLHGIFFGTLYAPAHALLFGFSLRQTILWIIQGIPWDLVHAFGNLAACMLVLPLVKLLRKLLKTVPRR